MGIELVGLRRLYTAHGFESPGADGLLLPVRLSPALRGSVYIGPHPPFGLLESTAPKYAVLGEDPIQLSVNYIGDLKAAGRSGTIFTEVVMMVDVDAPDELSRRFHQQEPGAQNEILACVEPHRAALTAGLDLVTGSLGLRFHRQLVFDLINESAVAYRDAGGCAISHPSPVMEVIRQVSLTNHGQEILKSFLATLADVTPDKITKAGLVFHWLLKAWPHQDPVNQFIALFVPLEAVLQGISIRRPKEHKQLAKEIRAALRTVPKARRAELLAFFANSTDKWRPSLEERFKLLAERAALPSWEADVQAFTAFNGLRNALLHRAQSSVQLRLTLSTDKVRSLEDLVERYVCYSLFGDAHVYPHIFRPSP